MAERRIVCVANATMQKAQPCGLGYLQEPNQILWLPDLGSKINRV